MASESPAAVLVRASDGAEVAIKDASTAPVVADKALVVAVSPNTPTLPVSGPLTDTQLRAVAVPVATGQLPGALVGGRLDENIGAWLGSTTPTVGQKTGVASLPVVIASDQSIIPVSGPLTDVQLRATAVPVSGPLTDTQLRATAVPVSGTVTANVGTTGGLALASTQTDGTQQTKITDGTNVATVKAASTAAVATDKAVVVAISPNNNVAVTGPLTDTQLRATAVPVSGTVTATGPLTDTQLRATAVPVSGPLTDTQLRATAVPVSGPLTDAQLRATAVPVSGTVTATGPLTDTQLRATAVPVSGTVTANVGTTGGLALAATQTDGTQQTKITDGTNVATVKAASTAPAATDKALVVAVSPNTPTLPVSGPLTDTQLRATAVPVSGTVTATGPLTDTQLRATAVPVSGTVTANIGTSGSLALDATLAAQSLVDNAPFTDGSSRVVPAGFILDETAGTALTENDVGAARIDSKRAVVHVIEDATTRGQRMTVTAANAAKVDGSAVTQPVSGTVTANIGTAGTLALDATLTGGTQQTKITDGTNVATVKAASTAAVATDKAVVVAVSPNNVVDVKPTSPVASAYLPVRLTDGTTFLGSAGGTSSNFGSAFPAAGTAMGLSDGTNLQGGRAFDVDSGAGTQYVQGVSLRRSASGGSTEFGTNTEPLVVRNRELATFTMLSTATAPANNKSMLSVLNAGSVVKLRILEIWITNVQYTGVTGVAGTFELRRITGHAAGTAITAIETLDSTDTLDSNVTVKTGSTVSGEATNLLWRTLFTTDEVAVTTALSVADDEHDLATMFPIWGCQKHSEQKPIVLRVNEGLTVKFATNSAVGSFDVMCIVTQE